MKLHLSIALFAVLFGTISLAAAQDVTEGTILALDRKARLLVLTDRTVWSLEAMKSALSDTLKAGDRIQISYESDEEGIGAINDISLLTDKDPGGGAADVSEGTVLVYDRKANVIVLTDRTVWALEALKSPLPAGVRAGSRIQIQYESDEEGISAINSIDILSN